MRVYADIFKALSDETRLTIMSLLLRHGELCVCDLVAVLQISQSKASRHLRYLKNAGLLDDRRKGIWVHYKVSDALSKEVAMVLKANHNLVSSLIDEEIESRLKVWLEKKVLSTDSCEAALNVKAIINSIQKAQENSRAKK